MEKIVVAIVAGGYSSEHPVSLKSAQGLTTFINNPKYQTYTVVIQHNSWDVQLPGGETAPINKNDFSFEYQGKTTKFNFAYITIHGAPGENGELQGYFDMINLPYSCCGVFAAAVTFDKYACNNYLKGFGINISPSKLIRATDSVDEADIVSELSLPCFVKPNGGGSSFATTKVKTQQELKEAIDIARKECGEVIVEKFMQGTEVTCGCYKTSQRTVVLPITEVVPHNEFFDYNAKYAGEVEEITPARIPQDIADKIADSTKYIYTKLGCKGIIRVDYIIMDSIPYLLEVNTTPGMTKTSFIPQQIAASGVEIGDVMTEIIDDILKGASKN